MNPTALHRATGTAPVPERPRIPVFGHALRIPTDAFTRWSMREARALGPIFNVRAFGEDTLMVSGGDLVAEVCDESRFRKTPAPLEPVREFGGDGLFTAYGDEPNWRKAHNILLPAFAFDALRSYHPAMVRVARRLLAKWDAHAGRPVDVAEDMTRLTLDTIGLCGFTHDFGCFERTEPHPFITSMVRALDHAQKKTAFIPGLGLLYAAAEKRQQANVLAMNRLADDIVRRRRAEGATGDGPDDLLSLMLHSVDKDTGESLDDTNIRYQLITFLIAGHETTSGALSFALYYLLKNPAVLAAAQAETDALWGDAADPDPSHADVGRLRYVRQVLNESLRLWPTAPAFAVEALADTVIGGRYPVRKGQVVTVVTPMLHRDPGWGDNAELFDPTRFAPEAVDARPGHLYKPFGNGERSCIGRQFALHEATLVLGLIVHRYRLLDRSDYQLKIKETLTIKPDGFTLVPVRRTSAERAALAPAPERAATGAPTHRDPVPSGLRAPGTTLTVLYGSNLGTSRAIAAELADAGARHGFATVLAPLDDAVDSLDPAHPVLVVASSYNGRPTDDAGRFLARLADGGAPAGLRYAVLGIGDRNWSATYQRIPTLIHDGLAAAGGSPLLERVAVDVSGDVRASIDAWSARAWTVLLERYGVPVEEAPGGAAPGARYTVADGDPAAVEPPATDGLLPFVVTENAELVDTAHELGRSKRLLRLGTPGGTEYRTGDHLLVRPANPTALVDRTVTLLDLDPGRVVVLRATSGGRPALPVDRPMTVRTLLTHFVELGRTATARQIGALAGHTPCPPERAALEALATAPGGDSVVDLLARHASCRPPLAELLDVLTPMNPRYYSVSSSPAAAPRTVDLMVAAHPVPHRDGTGTFLGTGAAFLAAREAGDTVYARLAPCREAFRLPTDPAVPVVLVSAGTGLAPFRAAVADRVATAGTARAAMLCYFGCDHPDVDYLHRAELEAAEAAGAVGLRPVFSRAPRGGARFVQDRLLAEGAEVWGLLAAGAHVRVCGDGRAMAPAVREALRTLHRRHAGSTAEGAEAWLSALMAEERYVEDVWAG
ncbi:cytochrome P450 [Streptomyces sp. NPDC049906]|uniref:cytochrome P450 n=1 Tax=Streptomyces sp. NPDC049906 TaxID=3155656 RepID=UPI00343AA2B6